MKHQLIVTADDFGFSSERNKGIMEAFNNGAVKSASLLLNCTGSKHAVECAQNTGLVLGLHLNLTEGIAVGQREYKTLTSAGEFRGKFGTREALDNGKIQIAEIEEEIESQITRFIELVGVKPDYVDGHQHIHLHPVVAPLFASALGRHGIPITRLQLEPNLEAKTWLELESREKLNRFVEEARLAVPVLQENGIRTSECFTGLSTMGASMTAERLQTNLLEAFNAAEKDSPASATLTCELMTHPGHPTPREHGGFSWGTDDFGHSSDRVHEIEVLSSEAMKQFYKRHNISLVSHRALVK